MFIVDCKIISGARGASPTTRGTQLSLNHMLISFGQLATCGRALNFNDKLIDYINCGVDSRKRGFQLSGPPRIHHNSPIPSLWLIFKFLKARE